jgi:hypothetical protein
MALAIGGMGQVRGWDNFLILMTRKEIILSFLIGY